MSKSKTEGKYPFIRTMYNRPPYSGIEMDSESMTVPDQTITLRELVTRYVRNVDGLPVRNVEFQDEDDDFNVNVASLDLTEIAELRDELNARARELRKEQRAEAQEPDEVGRPQKSDGQEPDNQAVNEGVPRGTPGE